MRIVAGRWRGRRIEAPKGWRVRPTGDRVREAWMSIVQPSLPGARVLDLFAGSGALGLECLSRGAASAEFVEIAPESLAALRENIQSLDAGDAAMVRRADAVLFVESLAAGAYDVAFADPPYDAGLAARIVKRWLAVPFAGVLGVEHRASEEMPQAEHAPNVGAVGRASPDRRRYGDTAITIFRL